MSFNKKTLIYLVLSSLLAFTSAIACETPEKAASSSDSDSDGDSDSDSDTDVDTDGDTDSDTDTSTGWGPGCQALDILFVIDDSGTMAAEQQMLIDAFPDFIEVLDAYQTSAETQLDYRIGVTTTGVSTHYYVDGVPGAINLVGRDGELITPDGADDPWIDGPGPDVGDQFDEIAQVGIYGPAYEMPLLAMQYALDKTAAGDANEGFLRQDALFVVIIISDEDDCSRNDDYWTIPPEEHSCYDYPVEHNVLDIGAFKGGLDIQFNGEGRYVVVVVAGMPDPDGVAPCDYGEDGAAAAGRLRDFVTVYVNENDQHGVTHDICEAQSAGNMSSALINAMSLIEVACDEYEIE